MAMLTPWQQMRLSSEPININATRQPQQMPNMNVVTSPHKSYCLIVCVLSLLWPVGKNVFEPEPEHEWREETQWLIRACHSWHLFRQAARRHWLGSPCLSEWPCISLATKAVSSFNDTTITMAACVLHVQSSCSPPNHSPSGGALRLSAVNFNVEPWEKATELHSAAKNAVRYAITNLYRLNKSEWVWLQAWIKLAPRWWSFSFQTYPWLCCVTWWTEREKYIDISLN